MWRILGSPQAVRQGQHELETKLRDAYSVQVKCRAGYQGGQMDIQAHWSDELGVWFASLHLPDEAIPRYWNGFGTERPLPSANLTITCEVNFPLDGVSRQVQGAFAVDGEESQVVYVVHRGKIGGGRRGVGREIFFRHYTGRVVQAWDDRDSVPVAIVGRLGADDLPLAVARFVREVEGIKQVAVRS